MPQIGWLEILIIVSIAIIVIGPKDFPYMLKKVGDITWHHHAGLMTFPMQTAAKYRIPLVIWGEHGEGFLLGMHNLDDNVEYTKKHRQEHLMRGFEPEDILDDPENKDITRTDLAPFFYPSDDEINSVGVRGIFTSNFDVDIQHFHVCSLPVRPFTSFRQFIRHYRVLG